MAHCKRSLPMPWPSDKSWFNVNLYCKTDVTDVGIVVLNQSSTLFHLLSKLLTILCPKCCTLWHFGASQIVSTYFSIITFVPVLVTWTERFGFVTFCDILPRCFPTEQGSKASLEQGRITNAEMLPQQLSSQGLGAAWNGPGSNTASASDAKA